MLINKEKLIYYFLNKRKIKEEQKNFVELQNFAKLKKNKVMFYGDLEIINEYVLLPQNLEILGDLILTTSDINYLPQKLKIHGNLILNHNSLDICYNDLNLGGDLILNNSLIQKVIICDKNKSDKIKIRKLGLNNIITESINLEYYDFSSIELYDVCVKNITKNDKLTNYLTSYLNSYKYLLNDDFFNEYYRSMIITILNYFSDNSLCSKLINNEIDLINKEEINLYLNNYYLHNFGIGTIIDYCLDEESIKFLYENNYPFTKTELNKINRNDIKKIYELYMLKSATNTNTTNQTKQSKYKHLIRNNCF